MMPDKGWRKKIHGRPARDLPPLKTTLSGVATAEDQLGDRRRPIGWRKTIHSSRPQTPSSISPLTPLIDDADDARSEHFEPQTPRCNSKPRLARYTSLFNSFKETSKGPDFAEPWSEDTPLPLQSYVDPLHALQSVHSHMIKFSTPIPLEHNSGLFRVFEDYRKVREEKERVETLLQDTLTSWEMAEKDWTDAELCYKSEIRRLELLIAKGTSGMTGLFKARQGSVIKRTGGHRKTVSHEKRCPTYSFVPRDQLDNEIQAGGQRISHHRSLSPSEKMAALSRFLTNSYKEVPLTKSSSEEEWSKLPRKAQSEVDLTRIPQGKDTYSRSDPKMSELHVSTDNHLPGTKEAATMMTESELEAELFNALRALGDLVARRRGIQVDSFVNGLMTLLSATREANDCCQPSEEQGLYRPLYEGNSGHVRNKRRSMRRFQSQPQLNVDQKRPRHFSFELGDDQLEELEEALDLHGRGPPDRISSDDDMKSSPGEGSVALPAQSILLTPSSHTSGTNSHKCSKIPSPVGTLGRSRRVDSTSSLQTVFARRTDGRRGSSSSGRTVFDEQSRHRARAGPINGSSSLHTLGAIKPAAITTDDSDDDRDAEKSMALVGARRTDQEIATRMPTSSSSAALLFGSLQSENVDAKDRLR